MRIVSHTDKNSELGKNILVAKLNEILLSHRFSLTLHYTHTNIEKIVYNLVRLLLTTKNK